MNFNNVQHLTIKLEGGGIQRIPMSLPTKQFFISPSKESAKAAGVKHDTWKFMNESKRFYAHTARLASTVSEKQNPIFHYE